MTFEDRGLKGLDYQPCRYGTSKLMFRGPAKSLARDYVTFLGGTETYGKFVQAPFPSLVEWETGIDCVNLGCLQAGPDVYLHDPKVIDICNGAKAVVLQIPHACNLSNRFFSVHPRRNDRFLRASTMLQALYHDIDFTDFTFVRHMLTTLKDCSGERYELVIEEMQKAWGKRMCDLLDRIDTPTYVFGLRKHHVLDATSEQPLGGDPLHVSDKMVLDLEKHCTQIAWITPSQEAVKASQIGMIYPVEDAKVCDGIMGPVAHKEVAKTLTEKFALVTGK